MEFVLKVFQQNVCVYAVKNFYCKLTIIIINIWLLQNNRMK